MSGGFAFRDAIAEKSMNILAIDTAAAHCSVMLRVGDGTFFCSENTSQRHSRHILQMIDQLILEAGIRLDELHLLAWNAGPGSFTGLRIGAGVIQALAYSFGLPVLSLSSLEILAHAALHKSCTALPAPTVIAVAMDARMNGVYWAGFMIKGDGLERCEPDQLLTKDTLEAKRKIFGDNCFVVGDAWPLDVAVETSAADVMALAVTKNKNSWLDNPPDCLPNYVHNTINWEKRQLRGTGNN